MNYLLRTEQSGFREFLIEIASFPRKKPSVPAGTSNGGAPRHPFEIVSTSIS
ncbi:MAG: hypothetical protein U9R75_03680 [Candidatus Thermoplasmatota archaeon]|nr:hypothetical protein [Candidatus Thermoplasmatota archaeon]